MIEIDAIKSTLSKEQLISFAYLFGSKVKNKESYRSDWDIAVYIKDEILEKNPVWQKFDIENRLSIVLKTDAVDVVILNYIDNPLFGFEIITKGILILNRDDELRVAFEGEALGRYQDWQYFMKRHMEVA
ncbi:MAG TPA: type VII toxin-antitoxin system MntA family adenylyltransferase antitoxin [Candidatus Brocadiia bacterium]|nr:nucleotidyltransferase domain-containing protein [Planctomycetota bacterium]MDO8093970.1 nucleotidyltransferase domain-containing protein [Candidatus Brocadiales bacterium]